MIEPAHLGLMAAGAAAVFILLILVVAAVALLLHRHEVREFKEAAHKHAEMRDELASMKALTLRAISARAVLETDLKNLQVTVKNIHDRVSKLEGL